MLLGLYIQAWISIMAVIIMEGPILTTKLSASGMLFSGMAALLMSFILDYGMEEGMRLIPIAEKGVLILGAAGLIHTATIKIVAYWPLGPPKSFPSENKHLNSLVAFLKTCLRSTARFFVSLLEGHIWDNRDNEKANQKDKNIPVSTHSNVNLGAQEPIYDNDRIGDSRTAACHKGSKKPFGFEVMLTILAIAFLLLCVSGFIPNGNLYSLNENQVIPTLKTGAVALILLGIPAIALYKQRNRIGLLLHNFPSRVSRTIAFCPYLVTATGVSNTSSIHNRATL